MGSGPAPDPAQATRGTVVTPSCPRCQGRVHDDAGDWACTTCGWRQHLNPDGTPYVPAVRPGVYKGEPEVDPCPTYDRASPKGMRNGVAYDGCDIASTCLECPLAQCKDENMGAYYAYRRALRHKALFGGIIPDALTREQAGAAAAQAGVTVRTVYRLAARLRLAVESAEGLKEDVQ